MTSAFSWQNFISLCPALFCITKPNMLVTLGISWLPTFAFQSLIMKKTCFGVLVLEGLVGLHTTVQLQLLQHYWSGHSFGLLWYWMVCLGNEQRSFCHFWDRIQVLHFGLFFFSIQKTKIMASGPITSWQINGEIVETVTDCIFGLQHHCRWWLQPWN